ALLAAATSRKGGRVLREKRCRIEECRKGIDAGRTSQREAIGGTQPHVALARLAGGLARREPRRIEALLARVVRELEGASILRGRLRSAPEPAQEVRAGGGQEVIAAERRGINAVEGDEPGCGPASEADRHRAIELDHGRGYGFRECAVMSHDRLPVRRVPGCRTCVAGGDRGLKLIGARARAGAG